MITVVYSAPGEPVPLVSSKDGLEWTVSSKDGLERTLSSKDGLERTFSSCREDVNLDNSETLLYNKMYDKFTLQFNNMQIIVAKVWI